MKAVIGMSLFRFFCGSGPGPILSRGPGQDPINPSPAPQPCKEGTIQHRWGQMPKHLQQISSMQVRRNMICI